MSDKRTGVHDPRYDWVVSSGVEHLFDVERARGSIPLPPTRLVLAREGFYFMQESPQFSRTIEDFICEHCGHRVVGNGYTNHCPRCLWSRHVDRSPGDRRHDCHGLMQPMDAFQKNGQWYISHVCQRCGEEKANKVASNDNFDIVIELSAGKG